MKILAPYTESLDIPRITLATTAPSSPLTSDIWIDTDASATPFTGCSVHRTTSDHSIASGSYVAVQWNGERYDTNTFHNNVTNNTLLTVPFAGYYHIEANVVFAASATGLRSAGFALNGGITAETTGSFNLVTPVSGDYTGVHTAQDILLTAGDYLEVYAYQNTGGALGLKVDYTAAQIRWIGA